jgi:tetratricopeptide (TPR) repeat protein
MTRIAVKASPWVSWKRTYAGGALALGVFAALVALFMIMRATGIGPVGSLLASGRLTERDQLLVTDFRGGGADSSLSAIVTEAIRTDLSQSSVVKVVPPSAVAQALERMRRDRSSHVDLPVAREIAAREGIKAIVDGGVTPLAGGYVVSVRLVDAATGDALASFRETIDGPSELLPTLDRLSGNLRGKIGESLKKIRANPPLEAVTTASLEALRKYAEGIRAFDIEGDNLKAASLFREAVAIDTAFGMAYRKLGVALGNAAMSEASEDSAYAAAYRHRARMTDVERYLTEGSYYALGPHADRKLSVQAYEALLRIDSLHPSAINNLARQLNDRREYARAESLLLRGIRSGNARATMFGNLITSQLSRGKFAAAESTAAESTRRFPANSGVRMNRIYVLTAAKQYDALEKEAARMLAEDPDQTNRASAAFWLREIAMVRGRSAEALRLTENQLSLDAARGNPPSPVRGPLDSAVIEIWMTGQPANAVQRLDAALAKPGVRALSPDDRRYLDFSDLYAQAGRPDRARAVLASFQAAISADTAYGRRKRPYYHMTLGVLALSERRPADAIRELKLGDRAPDGPRDICLGCTLEPLARAFDAAGMPDSAIATYERYVTTPSSFVWPDTYGLAPAHLRLAELYDSRRNTARAMAHYRKFVDLWKNADPALQPKVAKARARLAASGVR